MKITVYTISDCQFSKQEKEYLTSHTLQFEEKNLETNKEYLTEMLAVSNNFAGTPVTKIEKDDGQSVVLKGFTKEEFDKVLGFGAEPKQAEVKPTAPVTAAPAAAAPAPANPTPAQPVAPPVAMPPAAAPAPQAPVAQPAPQMPQSAPAMPQMPAPVQPQQPPAAPQAPAAPAAPAAPPVIAANDPSLDALLNDLQSKVNASKNAVAADAQQGQPPPPPPAQPGAMPSIPEPDFGK